MKSSCLLHSLARLVLWSEALSELSTFKLLPWFGITCKLLPSVFVRFSVAGVARSIDLLFIDRSAGKPKCFLLRHGPYVSRLTGFSQTLRAAVFLFLETVHNAFLQLCLDCFSIWSMSVLIKPQLLHNKDRGPRHSKNTCCMNRGVKGVVSLVEHRVMNVLASVFHTVKVDVDRSCQKAQ